MKIKIVNQLAAIVLPSEARSSNRNWLKLFSSGISFKNNRQYKAYLNTSHLIWLILRICQIRCIFSHAFSAVKWRLPSSFCGLQMLFVSWAWDTCTVQPPRQMLLLWVAQQLKHNSSSATNECIHIGCIGGHPPWYRKQGRWVYARRMDNWR